MNLKRIYDGMDIDTDTFTVSFNPTHQENIDTNDLYFPKPIYNTIDGLDIISVFERKLNDEGYDGNPVIYAMKNIFKGNDDKKLVSKWRFRNPSYDLYALLRRFVAVTKEIDRHFDTIITVPSSNPLNKTMLSYLVRIIPHTVGISDVFIKKDSLDVYENISLEIVESECLKRDESYENALTSLQRAFDMMRKWNDGVFSYKYIKPVWLRNAIVQSMDLADLDNSEIANNINGKSVLVIDDTYTTGKTLGDSFSAINSCYEPKEIVFLTLFSPLSKN